MLQERRRTTPLPPLHPPPGKPPVAEKVAFAICR